MKYQSRVLFCLACKKRGVDLHHVKSRGSGGTDEPENLMPLCRQHHIEWHQVGPGKMVKKYPMINQWLLDNNRHDVLNRIKRVKKR